jgi:hypothetical protein
MQSTGRFELEIRENAFVCVEDEAMTFFCEWKDMDPETQNKFKAMKQQVTEIIIKALNSGAKAGFRVVIDDCENHRNAS